MPDTIRPGNAVASVTVTIAAVTDQDDLSPRSLDSTVSGGTAPYTYSWTVNGAATGLSSASAADPTFTPSAGGSHVAVVTVTDSLGATGTAAVDWTVGKYVASIDRWLTLRASLDFTAEATASWLAAGATPTTRTIQGYDFTSRNADRATAFGLVNGSGIQQQNDGAASNRLTAPLLSVPMQEIIPGWDYGQPFVVQIQQDVSPMVAGAGYVGLSINSEAPTATSGEYVAIAGHGRPVAGWHSGFLDFVEGGVTLNSGTTDIGGPAHAQEIVCDGWMVEVGVYTTDPEGVTPDPGSSTRVPVVSGTPSDTGPVAWIRRTVGVAAEDPANANLCLLIHGNNTNCHRYIEHLWVWA